MDAAYEKWEKKSLAINAEKEKEKQKAEEKLKARLAAQKEKEEKEIKANKSSDSGASSSAVDNEPKIQELTDEQAEALQKKLDEEKAASTSKSVIFIGQILEVHNSTNSFVCK